MEINSLHFKCGGGRVVKARLTPHSTPITCRKRQPALTDKLRSPSRIPPPTTTVEEIHSLAV